MSWNPVHEGKPKRKLGKRRFENIKVGDQLQRIHTQRGWRGGKDDFHGPPVELSQQTWYYIVTDLWFDPVAGWDNHQAGEMVAIQHLNSKGEPYSRKEGHSIRGLASNSYRYAEIDYIAFCRDRSAAIEDGAVVGIGFGNVIRRRPELPSSTF